MALAITKVICGTVLILAVLFIGLVWMMRPKE